MKISLLQLEQFALDKHCLLYNKADNLWCEWKIVFKAWSENMQKRKNIVFKFWSENMQKRKRSLHIECIAVGSREKNCVCVCNLKLYSNCIPGTLNICMVLYYDLGSEQLLTKVCAFSVWSALLMFAYGIYLSSHKLAIYKREKIVVLKEIQKNLCKKATLKKTKNWYSRPIID